MADSKNLEDLQCKVCDYQGDSKPSLQIHMINMHEKLNLFECTTCGSLFNDRLKFHLHLDDHAGNKTLNCTFCDASFAVHTTLQYHTKVVHNAIIRPVFDEANMTNALTNEECSNNEDAKGTFDEKISEQDPLMKVEEVTEETPTDEQFKINVKEEIFSKAVSVTSGLGIKNIKCPFCDKCYSSQITAFEHMKKRHSDILICENCKVAFDTIDQVKNHILQGHNVQSMAKLKSYMNLTAMKDVNKTHKKKKDKAKAGINMDNSRLDKTMLKPNQRIYMTRDNNLACRLCDYVTNSKYEQRILEHIKVNHGGSKDIQCPFCTACYYLKTSAYHHIKRTHSDLLKCDSCNETCLSMEKLKPHVLSEHNVNFLGEFKSLLKQYEWAGMDLIADNVIKESDLTDVAKNEQSKTENELQEEAFMDVDDVMESLSV